jgi:hypothetical protein
MSTFVWPKTFTARWKKQANSLAPFQCFAKHVFRAIFNRRMEEEPCGNLSR